jgi:hypothetical protein
MRPISLSLRRLCLEPQGVVDGFYRGHGVWWKQGDRPGTAEQIP